MADRFKQALRHTYQQIRQSLSPTYQSQSSLQICKQISKLDCYRYAKRIALYQAVNGEVDLEKIWISAPLQGKYCYFPALNDDKTLSFLPATPSSRFCKNRYGILEPDVSREEAILPSLLDVMFIPLVSFDSSGTRLGMGAGYYDRTLALSRASVLIGVAFEFQHQTFIEKQHWDIPMNLVITESTVYSCNGA